MTGKLPKKKKDWLTITEENGKMVVCVKNPPVEVRHIIGQITEKPNIRTLYVDMDSFSPDGKRFLIALAKLLTER